jgi:two-component system sensor kinase FixL
MPHTKTALENLIRNAATAAVVADDQGNIVLASEVALKLFGYREDELVGQPISVLMPEQFRPTHTEYAGYFTSAVSRTLGKGRELTGLQKNGGIIELKVSLSPVILGDSLHVAAWIEDDTKRRSLEQELRVHHDRLAHMERLAFASEMVAGIAHELSQPLAASSHYAETIDILAKAEQPDGEAIRELTKPLIEQTLRAGQIVRNLRDFVSGRNPQPGLHCIDRIINKAIRFLQNEIELHSIQLRLEVEPELPQIHCVEIQIAQVLDNLIRNAIDELRAMPVTERSIEISAQMKDDAILVMVSDSGEGLSDDYEAQLFESFYTTKEQGMGVGLAICRTIIEQHGGTLQGINQAGGGACFSFTLSVGRNL